MSELLFYEFDPVLTKKEKYEKNHPAYNAPEKMKLLELSRVLRQQGLPPAYTGKGGGAIGHGSE